MIRPIDGTTDEGRAAWSLRIAMQEIGSVDDDVLPMLAGSWLDAPARLEIERREALDA